VAQVDFFGSALRRQHLKADPLTIEAVALPAEGRPAGVDAADVAANVGNYTLAARADRTTVPVGEAVTVTIEVRGTGNIRNVRPPEMPRLPGWKSYEPKVSVNVDPGEAISGVKSIEVLMLPEHGGTTTFPALEMPTYDPTSKRYAVIRSEPLRLDVTEDGAGAARAAAPSAPATAPATDNVIAPEVRPIRARGGLSRDMGATFLRPGTLLGLLLAPPFAFGLLVVVERLRERLAEETRQARRRLRTQVRKRLAAADGHRAAGRTSAFYIEIDRVLREMLAARLHQPVSGLRREELSDVLRARGMPAGEVDRVVAELEACDQARFAPGGDGTGAEAMAAALERAGELIEVIQKAPLAAAPAEAGA
jgi:hypothetical protein